MARRRTARFVDREHGDLRPAANSRTVRALSGVGCSSNHGRLGEEVGQRRSVLLTLWKKFPIIYLSEWIVTDISKGRDRSDEGNVATPEMASAGLIVLVDYLRDDSAHVWDLPVSAVAEAYNAMEQVRLRQRALADQEQALDRQCVGL